MKSSQIGKTTTKNSKDNYNKTQKSKLKTQNFGITDAMKYIDADVDKLIRILDFF
jgi:hypothetical protein